MLRALLSSFFWAFIILTSLICFPIAVLVWAVTALFDRRRRALHLFTCFWASLYTWFNPAWPVRIEGRDRIRRDRTYVMIANHQSLLDILVLFRLFVHFKWVSKEEIFRVPCIGWNMSLNRYIKLRRGDRESIARMMRHCGETLAEGSSVMIFPEHAVGRREAPALQDRGVRPCQRPPDAASAHPHPGDECGLAQTRFHSPRLPRDSSADSRRDTDRELR